MRPFLRLAFACLALLPIACAGTGPEGSKEGEKADGLYFRVRPLERIDCAPFIDPGSALAAEIASYEQAPTCERRQGPQGGHVEAFGVAGVAKARETAEIRGDRAMILVYRYFGWDEGLRPLGPEDMSGIKDFRILTTSLPIKLTGSARPGRVTRSEYIDDSVTRVCVDADTKNANGSRTLVHICRPVGILASDAAVMAVATDIGTKDFASINP